MEEMSRDWETFSNLLGTQTWDSIAQIEFVTYLEGLIGRTLDDSELRLVATKDGAKNLLETLQGTGS